MDNGISLGKMSLAQLGKGVPMATESLAEIATGVPPTTESLADIANGVPLTSESLAETDNGISLGKMSLAQLGKGDPMAESLADIATGVPPTPESLAELGLSGVPLDSDESRAELATPELSCDTPPVSSPVPDTSLSRVVGLTCSRDSAPAMSCVLTPVICCMSIHTLQFVMLLTGSYMMIIQRAQKRCLHLNSSNSNGSSAHRVHSMAVASNPAASMVFATLDLQRRD